GDPEIWSSVLSRPSLLTDGRLAPSRQLPSVEEPTSTWPSIGSRAGRRVHHLPQRHEHQEAALIHARPANRTVPRRPRLHRHIEGADPWGPGPTPRTSHQPPDPLPAAASRLVRSARPMRTSDDRILITH